jgi:hypothetical protein
MRLDHSVLRVLDHVEQDFLEVIVIRPDVGHRLEIGPDGDPSIRGALPRTPPLP